MKCEILLLIYLVITLLACGGVATIEPSDTPVEKNMVERPCKQDRNASDCEDEAE